MQDLYDTWLKLLSTQDGLLDELTNGLKEEKTALLSNQLESLRESTLKKDKATRKLEQLQGSLRQFSGVTAARFGLPQRSTPLRILFEKFDNAERVQLQKRRQDLLNKSKTISRLNQFNQSCLKIYRDEVSGMLNVLNLASRDDRTYRASGITKDQLPQGRLVSRSL